MVWYQQQIDGTVEMGEAGETETDRVWRRIDPQVAHTFECARERSEYK